MRRQAAGRRRAQGGPQAAGRAVGGAAPRPAKNCSRAPALRVRAVSLDGASRRDERREAVVRQRDRGQADGRKPGRPPKPAKRVPASEAKRGGPDEGCHRHPTAGGMPKAWREGNKNPAGSASSRARTGKWPPGRRPDGAPVRYRVAGAGTAYRREAEGMLLCGGDLRRRCAFLFAEHYAQAHRTAARAKRCNKASARHATGA